MVYVTFLDINLLYFLLTAINFSWAMMILMNAALVWSIANAGAEYGRENGGDLQQI